jgi:hypothetical protein
VDDIVRLVTLAALLGALLAAPDHSKIWYAVVVFLGLLIAAMLAATTFAILAYVDEIAKGRPSLPLAMAALALHLVAGMCVIFIALFAVTKLLRP